MSSKSSVRDSKSSIRDSKSSLSGSKSDLQVASKAAPLVGHLLTLFTNPMSLMSEKAVEGSVVKLRLGMSDVFLLSNVLGAKAFWDDTQENVKRLGSTPPALAELITFANNNVLPALDGDKHLQRKKMLIPAFEPDFINKRYVPAVEAVVQTFLDGIATGNSGMQFPFLKSFTREVIRTFLRLYYTATDNVESVIDDYVKCTQGISALPISIPFTTYHGAKKGAQRLKKWIAEQIAEHRAQPGKYQDTLQFMLEQKDPEFTDDAIIADLHHILFAGAGLANLVSNALFAMKEFPEVAKKLRAELDANAELLKKTPLLTTDVCSTHFPYTRNLLMETMRYYPIVAMAFGTANRDFEVDGHLVLQGSSLMMNMGGTHRNPAVWTDPMNFNPDRMDAMRKDPDYRYKYMPHGGGYWDKNHRCLGEQTNLVLATVVLVRLLSRFDVQVAQDLKFNYAFPISMPDRGLPCVCTPRSA